MKQTVTLAAHLLPLQEGSPIALVERWEKQLGETVQAGETLAVLRVGTETVSVPSPTFGVLAKRCVLPGEALEAGEPVAVLSGVPPTSEEVAQPVAPPPTYLSAGPEDHVTLSPFDAAIAAHQARSLREVPHLHTVTIADISEALRFIERARRGETVSGLSEGITLLPFVLSAVAASLIAFPAVNAQRIGDTEIRHKRYVHLGVERRNAEGSLLVPVVRDANRKSVLVLSREIADLTKRANSGQLLPDEVSGATFTVSEAPHVLYRTPILHRPLAAHLCFGKPVAGQIYLCLAHDARTVDNETAAAFLADVAQGLSDARFLFA